jgi:hypothetical protein
MPDAEPTAVTPPPNAENDTPPGAIRWGWLIPRAALLIALVWADIRTLLDSETWNIFAGLTLAVHEGGHLLFGPFGEWLMVAGGSLTQILAPVTAALLLLRQGDKYGVAIVGTWVTYSLTNLAEYVGDARAMTLQLVGFSSDPIHDWHYLLASVHLLAYDTRFALLIRDVAWLVLLASVALAAHVLHRGARTSAASTAQASANATPAA